MTDDSRLRLGCTGGGEEVLHAEARVQSRPPADAPLAQGECDGVRWVKCRCHCCETVEKLTRPTTWPDDPIGDQHRLSSAPPQRGDLLRVLHEEHGQTQAGNMGGESAWMLALVEQSAGVILSSSIDPR